MGRTLAAASIAAMAAVTLVVAGLLVVPRLRGQQIDTPEPLAEASPVTIATTETLPPPSLPNPADQEGGTGPGTDGATGKATPNTGATYWIDPANGDDTADGLGPTTAWGSLQYGLDRVQPGENLLLMSGSYNEQAEPGIAHYVMTSSGTPDAWIQVAAAPGHHPVLAPFSGNALSIRSAYVEVSGLTVVGRDYGPDNAYGWGLVIRNTHHVRVAGNEVSDMPVGGIAAIESSNVEIVGNDIHDNSFWGTEQGSGISIWHAADHGLGAAPDGYHDRIVGNRTYRNENKVFSRWEPEAQVISDGNGIIVDEPLDDDYVGRTLVANNLSFDNGGRGILVTKTARVDVVFNTTYHNGRTEILKSGPVELATSESTDVRILNNLAWARPGLPSLQVTWADDIVVGGNVFVTDSPNGTETDLDLITAVDPGLVAPTVDPGLADFRPRPDSLLIDRAVDIAPRLTQDADGQPRPTTSLDVGAYELN